MIRKLLWVLVAAAALVGAACGDDDDDAAADVDWSAVSADVTDQLTAAEPGIESVEVLRDGDTLKFRYEVTEVDGEKPSDAGAYAMASVEVMTKDYPEALDGVREVQARIGVDNYTYPYSEVQAWIEQQGIEVPDY